MKMNKKINIYEDLSLDYLTNIQKVLLVLKDALNAKKYANEYFIPKNLLIETDKYKLVETIDLINSDNIFINMNKVTMLLDDSLSKKGQDGYTEVPYYTETISRDDIENYLVLRTIKPVDQILKRLEEMNERLLKTIDQRDIIVVAYSKENKILNYKERSFRTRGLKALILDYLLRSKTNANKWWGYEDLIDVVGETGFRGFDKNIYKTLYDLNNSVKTKLLLNDFLLIADSKVRINPKYKMK